jgi:hypothetical protein
MTDKPRNGRRIVRVTISKLQAVVAVEDERNKKKAYPASKVICLVKLFSYATAQGFQQHEDS